MPVSASGAEGFDGKPVRLWIAHHRGWFIAVHMALFSLLRLTHWLFPGVGTTVTIIEWANLAVGLYVILVVLRGHDRKICPRCIDMLPANPSEVVEQKYHTVFRILHWFVDGPVGGNRFLRFSWRLLLVMIALIAVKNGVNYLAPGWGEPMSILLAALVVFVAESSYRHALLQTWCPWCRDDGPREPSPEPAPPPGQYATS